MILIARGPKDKPVGPVEVDWAHELTRGLVFACVCDDLLPQDLVSERFATRSGTPGFTNFYDGSVWSSAAGWAWAQPTGLDALTTDGTLVVLATLLDATGGRNALCSDESGAGDGVGIWLDDATLVTNSIQLWGDNNDVAGSTTDGLGTNAHLRLHKAGATWNGSNITFFNNGTQLNSPANAFAANSNGSRRTRIMARFNSTTTSSQMVGTAYAWNRALSADEMKFLSYDFWGFITPKSLRTWHFMAEAAAPTPVELDKWFREASIPRMDPIPTIGY